MRTFAIFAASLILAALPCAAQMSSTGQYGTGQSQVNQPGAYQGYPAGQGQGPAMYQSNPGYQGYQGYQYYPGNVPSSSVPGTYGAGPGTYGTYGATTGTYGAYGTYGAGPGTSSYCAPVCPPTGTGMGQSMYQQTGIGAGMGAGPNMQMMMAPFGIAADDTAVYVLRGSEVLKLAKDDLHVISSSTLPQPAGTGAGPAMGMGMQSTQSGFGQGPSIPSATGIQGTFTNPSECNPPSMAPAPALIPGAGPAFQPSAVELGTIRPPISDMLSRMATMPCNQLEKTYLQTMIQGHAGAIAWSKLAAQKATRPELQRFAQSVASEESRLNQRFSKELSTWYKTSPITTPTVSDSDELARLQTLSGRNFDIAYMRAMITSFNEAIEMSNVVAPKAVHSSLKSEAASMAKAHTRERQQLVTWLSQWYGVSM